MSKPSFAYWDIRGFGQPIRLLLAYLKVDYEEKRYTQEDDKEWLSQKFNLGLHFPNLPYWIDDKVKLTEKLAILKYVSSKYDSSLLPSNADRWVPEMLEGVMTDVWNMLVDICYHPSDAAEEAFKTGVPLKLGQLNVFIGNNTFTTGNKLSYVDFLTYEVCDHLTVLNAETLKPYPNILKFMKNFLELPAIQAYMKSDKCMKAPCFSKHQQKYHI